MIHQRLSLTTFHYNLDNMRGETFSLSTFESLSTAHCVIDVFGSLDPFTAGSHKLANLIAIISRWKSFDSAERKGEADA